MHKRSITLPGSQVVMIDMESVDAFRHVIQRLQPDIVINCASLTTVEGCEKDPALAMHLNVELASYVAQACKLEGIQSVHISTDHLFNGHAMLVKEEEPLTPVNEYGRTKALAEERILSINESSLVIRTNFYGWGPRYRPSFSDHIISSLRDAKPAYLFTDVYYTPILISSFAEIAMALIEKKAAGIFHIAGRERISKFAFGTMVAQQFGLDVSLLRPIRLSDRTDLVKRPLDMSLSNQKAAAFTGRDFGFVNEDIKELYRQEQSGFSKIILSI